ncbi:hypothetical protein E3O55_19015 [Cryobacterium sp. MDB1-18-2]|uniref:hypothetical protein n=1 Tax=unclassified Cryobacterium TaxID=2649013 RepID=UPI00106A8D2C|nr:MULTISPECIES: hypothetical protein [unclassified Cryobacterium]TFC22109.1 hypothetical protein E3O55_19015 [Cryobacterium sp. MDB1-18-2]TFC40682.1 hypothetical protein E3O50_12810 [Cryobacterium sp. MDB1-18-1]
MLTLLGDKFAPLTSRIGLLRLPLSEATEAFRVWRDRLYGPVTMDPLEGSLERILPRLEPLTNDNARDLLVGTSNPEWTAVFDSGFAGGNQISTVGHIAQTVLCQGLVVQSVPDTIGRGSEDSGRFGALQFQMLSPLRTHFLNHVRAVGVTHDDSRWRFGATGTVQDFEQVEAYEKRSVRSRFTEQMMVDYCAALGLRPFDADFYPGPASLITNPNPPLPHALVLSLAQARARLGI